jgi:hypothetical protein
MVLKIPDDLKDAFIEFLGGGLYFMAGLGCHSEEDLTKDELRLFKIVGDFIKSEKRQTRRP